MTVTRSLLQCSRLWEETRDDFWSHLIFPVSSNSVLMNIPQPKWSSALNCARYKYNGMVVGTEWIFPGELHTQLPSYYCLSDRS